VGKIRKDKGMARKDVKSGVWKSACAEGGSNGGDEG